VARHKGKTGEPDYFDSQDERDQGIESKFQYHREGQTSTLAYVALNKHRLIKEFFDWKHEHAAGLRVDVAMWAWEVKIFGAHLDNAAHGMLLKIAERQELIQSERWLEVGVPYVVSNPRQKGEGVIRFLERIARAMGYEVEPLKNWPALSDSQKAEIQADKDTRVIVAREPGEEG